MGRIRFQVVIALVAILGLALVLGYVAFRMNRVTVPEPGGVYVEGLAGTPQTINPLLAQANPVDQDLAALIYSGLTKVDEQGRVQPDLATRWDISAGGTIYTFYLREDVTWHDGAPFTADDVVFTIGLMQNQGFQGAADLADLWRTVAVEALDDYMVRFTLREPYAPFLEYTTIGLLPAHVLRAVDPALLAESDFNGSPIGTGPFCVQDINVQRVTLVPYAAYYGPVPYLQQLEFRFYPDTPSVFEARKRGEIQGISRVLPEYLDEVRQDSDLTLYNGPLAGYNLVILNLDRPMFQGAEVRRAMMYALDRQALIDSALDGQGRIIHSPILPNSWAYDPNVFKYTYDPAKARSILDEAGWYDQNGDGIREQGSYRLEFALVTNDDDPVRKALVEGICTQLRQVGIQANPTFVSWDVLVSEQLRLRRFDAVLIGWQNLAADPDPYPYWHSSQATEEGFNFAGYISEDSDRVLEAARLTTDEAERAALYAEFQAYFAEDVPSLLLYQPIYSYAVDSNIQGVQIGVIGEAADRFRNIADWYTSTQRMLYTEAREKGLIDGR
ncbi:MAG: ABC transporter substrate-binding protein [Anaerolineales bacterium]